MVGNLGNAVRRRKTSGGSNVEAAAAAATAAGAAPATEELSVVSPPAQTSAPTGTVVSPIAETSEITSPIGQESMPIPTPVENREAAPAGPFAPEAPFDPAVDLSSPPASPTVAVAPVTIQPTITPPETPAVPNIEESAVLVEPPQPEVEVASVITKTSPVSSAAEDTTFKQKQEEAAAEQREFETDHEQDWEKLGESQQVRPQASFDYSDDGALADHSAASSIAERGREADHPSAPDSPKDKAESRAGVEDEQADFKATTGDPTAPSEGVPPAGYTVGFVAKESAQTELAPPMTPHSDESPEHPKDKRDDVSELVDVDLDERASLPGNNKEPAPNQGVEGGIYSYLPSRETIALCVAAVASVLATTRYIYQQGNRTPA
ncbi:hypothetical protein FRC01_011216 [Tulasnella sp. 417]|nr:hypothetical protein FRC01_011216 [Tulasnella sp. 417]